MSSSSYIHPGSLHRVLNHHPVIERRLARAGIESAGMARLKGPFWVRRSKEPYHAVFFQIGGRGSLGEHPPLRHVIPGERVIAPSLTTHYYGSRIRWDKIWFHLYPDRWHLPTHTGDGPFIVGPARYQDEIRWITEALFRELDRPDTPPDGMIERLTDLLILTLRREWDPGPDHPHPDRSGLDQILLEMRQNPSRDWTLERMTKGFPRPISPNHFYKICMKHMKASPREILTRTRMEHAQELLTHTPLPLEQVAAIVGYANAFAFSAAYKRHTGHSPSRDRVR